MLGDSPLPIKSSLKITDRGGTWHHPQEVPDFLKTLLFIDENLEQSNSFISLCAISPHEMCSTAEASLNLGGKSLEGT